MIAVELFSYFRGMPFELSTVFLHKKNKLAVSKQDVTAIIELSDY